MHIDAGFLPGLFDRFRRRQATPSQPFQGFGAGDTGGDHQARQAHRQNKPLYFHHRRVSIVMFLVRLLLRGATCLGPAPRMVGAKLRQHWLGTNTHFKKIW
ncbi:hypothetical protein Veis_1946 [Verminephrobacter eiseniae EF01-2]|uniref:Uncharacterized protein n=1 Tax=Verminephrobacter eiseniae (strain EF01-2) TaxID=391735 RepID=A1WJ92_VEREI|nr:hypothetical protein Veis_1946 [Verminephrobacter eiseniae EF01-2]